MPRTNRRGKLPRGPKGKQYPPSSPKPSTTFSSTSRSRSRSRSPNKQSMTNNNTREFPTGPAATTVPSLPQISSFSTKNDVQPEVINLNNPSGVLSSILSTLDLSFDKDIGMIKGNHVKNIPQNKETLLDLQNKLNLLNDLFNQIIKDDKNKIDQIRQLEKKVIEKKEFEKSKLEDIQEREKTVPIETRSPEITTTSDLTESKPANKEESKEAIETTEPIEEKPVDHIKSNITDTTLENNPLPINKNIQVEITPVLETKSQDPPLLEKIKPVDISSENKAKETGTDEVSKVDATKDKQEEIPASTSVPNDSEINNKTELKDEQITHVENKSAIPTPATTEENEKKRSLIEQETPNNDNKETNISTIGGPELKKIKLEETESKQINDTVSAPNNTDTGPSSTIVTALPTKNIITQPSKPTSSFILENDARVKNPKSEFVVSQTLPKAAKDLGLYNEEGLESTGEDYLKRKYNVASYPTNDLKELLPGPIPDNDYSCPKPANQIQYNTFLSFVDNFFRDLNDEDIKLLENKFIIPWNLQMDKSYDPESTPFVIPKLGPIYTNVWLKEDSKTLGNISPLPFRDPTSILPKKSAASLNNELLETEDISCGPLLSRLLCAILEDEKDDQIKEDNNADNDIKNELSEDTISAATTPLPHSDNVSVTAQTSPNSSIKEEHEHVNLSNPLTDHLNHSMADPSNRPLVLGGGTTNTLPNEDAWNINTINLDYPTFEERLKRELKYVGIYMNLPKDENNPNGDDPDWLNGREDDEISSELRELQSNLKNVTKRNQRRKEILKPLLEKELAWQEYYSILDDLDKQIDQAYIKRIRAPKKKKKHHSGSSNHHGGSSTNSGSISASQQAQQKAANSSLKALLDKRQRWISKIGPLFDKPEIMKRIPKESIFKDLDQDEEEEEAEGDVFDEEENEEKEDALTEA